MSDSEKEKITKKERQIARINQLKARLQNEEAKLRSQARKDRDGQLVAFGIFLERKLLAAPLNEFKGAREAMKASLKGKTLEHALAGMERLAKEKNVLAKKKEISSEPPSRPPAAEATEKSPGSA